MATSGGDEKFSPIKAIPLKNPTNSFAPYLNDSKHAPLPKRKTSLILQRNNKTSSHVFGESRERRKFVNKEPPSVHKKSSIVLKNANVFIFFLLQSITNSFSFLFLNTYCLIKVFCLTPNVSRVSLLRLHLLDVLLSLVLTHIALRLDDFEENIPHVRCHALSVTAIKLLTFKGNS